MNDTTLCCGVCRGTKGDMVSVKCQFCGQLNLSHAVCIIFMNKCIKCDRAFCQKTRVKFDKIHSLFCRGWREYEAQTSTAKQTEQRRKEAKREVVRIQLQKTINSRIKTVFEERAIAAYRRYHDQRSIFD